MWFGNELISSKCMDMTCQIGTSSGSMYHVHMPKKASYAMQTGHYRCLRIAINLALDNQFYNFSPGH